ncbi:phage tail tip fiber protein, partial [Pseudomonas piscis]|uniref:phage tail tip fiber protein n=1 Tax=Pseudomonas piscis TaxID=2614538 RepID=UPI0034A0BFBD
MWAIDSPTLAVQQFRVLSVAEDFSDSAIKYSISAVKHVGAKFAAIDNGARIDRPPVTVIPPSVQNPPKNVRVRNEHFVDQGSAVGVMTIDWERPDNAIAYEVHWRKNDGDWVFAGRTGGNSFEVSGIYAGRYVAKVRAINALDIGSVFATSAETVLSGKTTPPPMVASFNAESIVFGIKLKWSIPAGLSTADLQRTEIWYSQSSDVATATKFGDYAYPQTDLTIMGLAAGVRFFFWARLVDKIGNQGPYSKAVVGHSSSDAGPILEYLSDQISETQLSKELLRKVETGGGSAVEIKTMKDELSAMYSIKTQMTVDGKPYLAGIGVGVENDKGIVSSQVLIAANRFAIVDPQLAEPIYPFVVSDGKVFIDEAFIGKGSITTAKIGGSIKSTNYIAGETGWCLGED